MNNTNRKALFVLHEGIGSTIFNSQVAEHVKSMKEHQLTFDILSYDTFSKTWQLSNENLKKFSKSHPDHKIILKKAANIYYPFSTLHNLILLIKFFLKNRHQYSFIHARADYTAFLCIITRPFHGLPVYWDCRGDAISELKDSLSRKGILLKTVGLLYLIPRSYFIAFINSRFCKGAIFVSDALYKLFEKKLVSPAYAIIPCPVSEQKFFFDTALRSSMRKKLNIGDEKTVYLYSGSMVAYQSIEEQYDMYKRLLSNSNYIVTIATSEPEKAKEFFNDLQQERLIITRVSFEEMNAYYNLADFAFLLREAKQLNFVASPTKHGEYCLTGLPVIMNDTVDQAVKFSKIIGNYIAVNNMEIPAFSESMRAEIAGKAMDFYSRKALNARYVKLYASAYNG